jgi:tetrathionate reductase subunit B
MNHNRREFLKKSGLFLAGSGLSIALFPVAGSSARASSQGIRNLYAFIVNTETCIGCGKCVEACKKENRMPDPFYRTWVERYTVTNSGEVLVDSPKGAQHGFPPLDIAGHSIQKSYCVPKLCNHCAKPNCVQVCPVGATYVTSDGFVLVDEKHCVGCSYCVQACPYGARYIDHHDGGTADKCTWCYHRIKQGMAPACVEVCPVGARLFGRIDDPDSSVSAILRDKRLQVLKPELGNNPMTFYIGLDKEVR